MGALGPHPHRTHPSTSFCLGHCLNASLHFCRELAASTTLSLWASTAAFSTLITLANTRCWRLATVTRQGCVVAATCWRSHEPRFLSQGGYRRLPSEKSHTVDVSPSPGMACSACFLKAVNWCTDCKTRVPCYRQSSERGGLGRGPCRSTAPFQAPPRLMRSTK